MLPQSQSFESNKYNYIIMYLNIVFLNTFLLLEITRNYIFFHSYDVTSIEYLLRNKKERPIKLILIVASLSAVRMRKQYVMFRIAK